MAARHLRFPARGYMRIYIVEPYKGPGGVGGSLSLLLRNLNLSKLDAFGIVTAVDNGLDCLKMYPFSHDFCQKDKKSTIFKATFDNKYPTFSHVSSNFLPETSNSSFQVTVTPTLLSTRVFCCTCVRSSSPSAPAGTMGFMVHSGSCSQRGEWCKQC
jgi:hypothetical protein